MRCYYASLQLLLHTKLEQDASLQLLLRATKPSARALFILSRCCVLIFIQVNYTTSTVSGKVRGKVSKKKRRYEMDGFNLDLSYITDRVIAMGFPSSKLEGVYRNNMKEVRRFLDKRHQGCYKVGLFCSVQYVHLFLACGASGLWGEAAG